MTETLIPDQQPTPEFMVRLFGNTFKFSQGNDEIQTWLMEEIHRRHPGWRVEDMDELDELAAKGFTPILFPSQTNTLKRHQDQLTEARYEDAEEAHDSVEWVRNTQIGNLDAQLSSHEIQPSRIKEITLGMIREDYRFLVLRQGRPRAEYAGHYNPDRDKMLSYLFYYAILDKPTGMEVFDEIMDDVRMYIQTHWEEVAGTICSGTEYNDIYNDQKLEEIVEIQPHSYGGLLRQTMEVFNADQTHQQEGLQVMIDVNGLHAA